MSVIKINLNIGTASKKAVETAGWVVCKCGVSRKAAKPCPFCGDGTTYPAPRSSKNRYVLVDADEMSAIPKGDWYVERMSK